LRRSVPQMKRNRRRRTLEKDVNWRLNEKVDWSRTIERREEIPCLPSNHVKSFSFGSFETDLQHVLHSTVQLSIAAIFRWWIIIVTEIESIHHSLFL
jgi:hypothetical protein